MYGIDKPADTLLADCYRNALQLAESNKIQSIAFPAISTGAFGYPLESATCIAFEVVFTRLSDLLFVKHIRFVLYENADLQIYKRVFDTVSKR